MTIYRKIPKISPSMYKPHLQKRAWISSRKRISIPRKPYNFSLPTDSEKLGLSIVQKHVLEAALEKLRQDVNEKPSPGDATGASDPIQYNTIQYFIFNEGDVITQ